MDNPRYRNSKINSQQVGILLSIALCPQISLRLLRDLSETAGTASWLIILVAGVFALIHFVIMANLLQTYPQNSLIEIAETFWGKFGRISIGILSLIFFFNQLTVLLYALSFSFLNTIFSDTPIIVIILLLLLLTSYAVFQGIECISRSAFVLAPFLLISLIGVFFFAFQHSDIDAITPVFSKGFQPLLNNPFQYFYIFSNVFLLNSLNPHIQDSQKLRRIGSLGLISAIIINLLFAVSTTAVFGPNLVSILNFPVLHLTSLFSFYEYLQHFDAIFIFLWFFVVTISLSLLFFSVVKSFIQTFNSKKHRPIIVFISLLILCCTLLLNTFDADFQLSIFLVRIINPPIAFGIPTLLWLFSWWYKRKENH